MESAQVGVNKDISTWIFGGKDEVLLLGGHGDEYDMVLQTCPNL